MRLYLFALVFFFSNVVYGKTISDSVLGLKVTVPDGTPIGYEDNVKGRSITANFRTNNGNNCSITAGLAYNGGFGEPIESFATKIQNASSKQLGQQPYPSMKKLRFRGKTIYVSGYSKVRASNGQLVMLTMLLFLEETTRWSKVMSISFMSDGDAPLSEAEVLKQLTELHLEL